MTKISKNISLKKYTTLGLGGSAKFFTIAKTEKELLDAIEYAQKKKLQYMIVGGGSNLLIHEDGYDGLVIKNEIKGIKQKKDDVIVKSGTILEELITFLNNNGLFGMGKMAGIPGTVGGAIRGNAGAYGQTISDWLMKVKVFDGKKTRWIQNHECKFAYRESTFKHKNHIILEAVFFPRKGEKNKLKETSKEIIELRSKKYSKNIKCPGSYFKNVLIKDLPKNIISKIPKEFQSYGKIPAGQLLDEVGARGAKMGGIKIADHHANLFMNTGKGKATDFVKLAERYKNKVKEKFGIELEPEVQLVGFDKTAVLGLGMEGRDLVEHLAKKGVDVAIFDEKKKTELDLKGISAKVISGENYLKGGLDNYDVIYRSPGVYRYIPELVKAEKKGVKVSSALKLFFDLCPSNIIGVTGTKGKGTTATLVYEILKKSGKDVYLAGNIGKPYLSLLPRLTKESWVILEISSFQLIDMQISPHISVVLNITSDHMDWHKDQKEYVDAKKNMVKFQTKNDFAVLSKDYKISKDFSKLTKAKVKLFSKKDVSEKQKNNLLLKGEHNLENISAAISVVRIIGVPESTMFKVVSQFKGLEHRLELVGEVKEVKFYNDSFATGPQPTSAAIKAFDEPITVILGGSEKKQDYTELGKLIAKRENVANVVLIGDMASRIRKSLKKANYQNNILDVGKPKMKEIVKIAFKNTPKGGVVLLSPAAASFDMFENYKDRGKQFKNDVLSLNKHG